MNNSYTTTTTTNTQSAGIMVVVYLLTLLLFTLPSLITTWRLYKKAGKAGWAAIVPIYNAVVQLQIAKMPTWYILLLFVPVANLVIVVMALVNFAKQYNRKLGFWLAYIFLPIVAVFLVGKTEYTGGETVSVTAMPVSPADTAALAPAPVGTTPKPAFEPAAPAVGTTPVEPVIQTPVAPAESADASPVIAAAFDTPTTEIPAPAPVEPSPAPVNPWEQPSSSAQITAVEPATEEPTVVSPELGQSSVQTEQSPDTTQQSPATPPQRPLQ